MIVNVGNSIVLGSPGPTAFPKNFMVNAIKKFQSEVVWVHDRRPRFAKFSSFSEPLRKRKKKLSAGQIRKRNKKIARPK